MTARSFSRAVILETAPWLVVAGLAITHLVQWTRDVTPASAWFEVNGVTVSNAQVGQPIIMNVSRTIHAPFHARWVATVRRIRDDGLELACSSSGENDYRTANVLPKPLTLDWWTHPIVCKLEPGRYRLDTLWLLDVQGYPVKTVSAQSNIFEIETPR